MYRRAAKLVPDIDVRYTHRRRAQTAASAGSAPAQRDEERRADAPTKEAEASSTPRPSSPMPSSSLSSAPQASADHAAISHIPSASPSLLEPVLPAESPTHSHLSSLPREVLCLILSFVVGPTLVRVYQTGYSRLLL